MKNILIISTTAEELLSNVDDGTNRLFINGTEIPSTDWVGTGNYTATVEGHAVTIKKIGSLAGNISLANIGTYSYELRKRSGGGVTPGVDGFAFDIVGGDLILYYSGDTPPDMQIDSTTGHLIMNF